MIGLCRVCRRAVYSWQTPALFDGMPDDTCWTHYVPPLRGEEHPTMVMPGVRDRVLHCATCRQPQQDTPHGWQCLNRHCTGTSR